MLFDDVVADVSRWAAELVPAFTKMDRITDADEVYKAIALAATQSAGPLARQARARVMVFQLGVASDEMAQQYKQGPWDANAEQRLTNTIQSCHQILERVRLVRADRSRRGGAHTVHPRQAADRRRPPARDDGRSR
jgi:hypothetical protein